MTFQAAKLTDSFWVSPQIDCDDLDEIARQGVTHLVCNRPDREVADQPDYADIARKAAALGLEIAFLPIDQSGFQAETIQHLQALLAEKPTRILAYCRSGTRSTYLWALAHAGGLPADDILQTARQAGYDISNIEMILREAEQQAATPSE